MRRNILGVEELSSKILKYLTDSFKEEVVAVLLFGSTIYWGSGKDVDIIVVVSRDLEFKEKFSTEYKVKKDLCRIHHICNTDIHVMSIKEFRENLTPGTFLSGIALGYKILLDHVKLEKDILSFLESLSSSNYTLHNRYGKWSLSKFAMVTLKKFNYTMGFKLHND